MLIEVNHSETENDPHSILSVCTRALRNILSDGGEAFTMFVHQTIELIESQGSMK